MPAGQIGADNSSDSDSSDSDTDEMPFLAGSSAEAAHPKPGPEPAGTKEGRHSDERHSKEVMEIPEAVEAVTGVNASYLPVQHFSCLLAILLLTQRLKTDFCTPSGQRQSAAGLLPKPGPISGLRLSPCSCLGQVKFPCNNLTRIGPDIGCGVQDHNRESQEGKQDRRGLRTGADGVDPGERSSFETLTPTAKAVASAARAAACQVIMTPGGPLPSPAGCPGHAAFHAAHSASEVRPLSPLSAVYFLLLILHHPSCIFGHL